MRFRRLFAFAAVAVVLAAVVPAQNRKDLAEELRRGAPSFRTEVPAHPFDVVLGRPTLTSIAVSVMAAAPATVLVEHGPEAGGARTRTAPLELRAGEPAVLEVKGLRADTGYRYALLARGDGGEFAQAVEGRFHTARPAGQGFTFTVHADSHLDGNTAPELFGATLRNALADHPDFHVDLGDTFMVDKFRRNFRDAAPMFVAQRYWLGLLCAEAPLFFVVGNHDGETGFWRGGNDDMAQWTNAMRRRFLPSPAPDGFYTGNPDKAADGDFLRDYYAWTWGDALCVVLDPFWYSTDRRARDCWRWTLGEAQHRWLEATLAASKARFRFVFVHHLVGGATVDARGGATAVRFGEWGGADADGQDAFATKRPGFAAPIHPLLVKHGVTAVFHGHDHLYAREECDGIVYQLLPQPGHPGDTSRSAAEYGYPGEVVAGSGHLRVRVAPEAATVEFVRVRANGPGVVADRYTLTPRGAAVRPTAAAKPVAPLPAPQSPAPAAKPRTTAAAPPNFVVVQGEGQGWSSLSVAMGADGAHAPAGLTPQLERLAQQGLVFSSFYAASPRCTPSRAALVTGLGPAKLQMTFVNEGGTSRRGDADGLADAEAESGRLDPPHPRMDLPQGIATVADLLKKRGYATAHFGKWHVGRSGPGAHGFDEHDGANTNQGPDGSKKANPAQGEAITARGIAFATAQVKAGKPFYLQIDHYGGGSADESRPETRQALAEQLQTYRGKEGHQAAILADVDRNLGALLKALDELGVADTTYVFFTTDHGAPGRNPPLVGGKGSLQEGGVRVPFVVRGPGVRVGRTDVRAIGFDLPPTILDLAGAREWPAVVEGGSLAAVLRGESGAAVKRPRAELVMHFPHYDHGNGGPQSALWLGDWKLLRSYENGADRLFDLRRDPRETVDLAGREPAKAAELGKLLEKYLAEIGAQMATPKQGKDDVR